LYNDPIPQWLEIHTKSSLNVIENFACATFTSSS
jgi:hypothetical protein